MFKRRFYTQKQRKLYGWGWFAIFFLVGGVFRELGWIILSYIFFFFCGLSLFTAYFGKNDTSPPYKGEFTPEDFDNPKDYADNILRCLRSMKKTLLGIKKLNKGKLTKKDIVSAIKEMRPTYNELDPSNKFIFRFSPELQPFQFQVFFHEPPEFQIEVYAAKGFKYEGFNAGIWSDEKKIRVNIITDWLHEKPTTLTKKLNKILLKDPNVVDDALIEKPWKAKK